MRYPCAKNLTKVTVVNQVTNNKAKLADITSYRLRVAGGKMGDAGVSLSFKDAGSKATYTAVRAKDGTWSWFPKVGV